MGSAKRILYSNHGGEGFILKEGEPKPWRKQKSSVLGIELVPGVHSDLAGYFNRPLEYCGIYDDNGLVFFIGSVNDLFGSTYYYQVIHRISETRLFSMFTWQAGRDFNWIGGRWK